MAQDKCIMHWAGNKNDTITLYQKKADNMGNRYQPKLVCSSWAFLTSFTKASFETNMGTIKYWTKKTKNQKKNNFILPSWGGGVSPWPNWSWLMWPPQEKRTLQLSVWQCWTRATGISLLCNWHKWQYWTGNLLVSGSPHYHWDFSDSSELCGSRSLPPGRASRMQILFSTESHPRVCRVGGSHNMRCMHQRSSNISSCEIHWREVKWRGWTGERKRSQEFSWRNGGTSSTWHKSVPGGWYGQYQHTRSICKEASGRRGGRWPRGPGTQRRRGCGMRLVCPGPWIPQLNCQICPSHSSPTAWILGWELWVWLTHPVLLGELASV